ncbi:MAG: hypothetical protein WC909_01375 [Candidatus Paceibacterota bacterium]|jgi:transcription elongation factor Elf1
MIKKSGARQKERRTIKTDNQKVHNNYGFKMGTCPKCGKELVPLTEHHIWKRSVWGPNNRTVFLCRDCHNELERKVRIMENMILRLFMFCYKAIYRDFMSGSSLTNDDIMKICLTGLKKMISKILNESLEVKQGWIVKMMKKKDILLEKMQK